MAKYVKCPNCGYRPPAGLWRKVYRCSKCGNVHCSNCGSSKCPKCGSASRYHIAEIYGK